MRYLVTLFFCGALLLGLTTSLLGTSANQTFGSVASAVGGS